jgi:hypothetical protein
MRTDLGKQSYCPHCESKIEGITGTGFWICPKCGGEIEVSCSCPECYEEVEIPKWGRYSCPNEACVTEFDAARCADLSSWFRPIECPGCDVRVEGVTGTGDWTCATCKTVISVRSFCPKCGQEVEADEWGGCVCPVETCDCDFDPANNVYVSTEEHGPVWQKRKDRKYPAGRQPVRRARCIDCGMRLFKVVRPPRKPSLFDLHILGGRPNGPRQTEMPIMQCPVCSKKYRCFPLSNMK